MIHWIHVILSDLTYTIGINHPLTLTAIFWVGVANDIGFPLPFILETFLLFASYYVGPVSYQVLLIIGMLLAGRESGGAALYWLSRGLGQPLVNWLERHIPGFQKGIEDIKKRLNKRTVLAVTLIRLTPGLMQFPALVTGSLHLPYIKFALGVAISGLIYDFLLVLLGYIFSIAFSSAPEEIKEYIVVGLIIGMAIVWAIVYIKYRLNIRAGQKKHANQE